ncbi:MAG TPA: hypothetical protein VFX02_04085 [Gammaproteobacteria bacterium]|nr:hypothetical protein [Gammaproteobacteria bacterium]
MISSRNPLLLTLIFLQAATFGLLLFIILNTPERNLLAADRPISMDAIGNDGRSLSAAELKTELRAIVRSEIAALSSTAALPAPISSAAGNAGLSESERELQEQAAAASGSVIRQAVAAGVWTPADSQALMQHVARISAEQRLELVDEFYAAINRQELKLEDFPPL